MKKTAFLFAFILTISCPVLAAQPAPLYEGNGKA